MTTQHPTTPKAPKDPKNTTADASQNREHPKGIDREPIPMRGYAHPAAAGAGAHTPLIASTKVDKWLNELRQILVDRSEFKLADHVVSARVVIKMLERKHEETAAERDRLRELVGKIEQDDDGKLSRYEWRKLALSRYADLDQAREQVKALKETQSATETDLREQVKTLLAACKAYVAQFDDPLNCERLIDIIAQMRAAIAAVESEGQ